MILIFTENTQDYDYQVTFNQGQPGLIPCRPAHPKFNVSLERKTAFDLLSWSKCPYTTSENVQVITYCNYTFNYTYTSLPWEFSYMFHPRLGFIFEK